MQREARGERRELCWVSGTEGGERLEARGERREARGHRGTEASDESLAGFQGLREARGYRRETRGHRGKEARGGELCWVTLQRDRRRETRLSWVQGLRGGERLQARRGRTQRGKRREEESFCWSYAS
ncbi:hypothetical protein OIU78_026999 [Salix suchowensis]|nr:hypothetical protein OIU78_026999 [Salix suchowensis]